MRYCDAPVVRRLARSRVLAAAVVLAAVAGNAWASAQQLVVVRKSGQTTSYAWQGKSAAAATAACSDESVAFAFLVEPQDGIASIELQHGVDTARDVPVAVTVTCSILTGSALVPFDARDGTAVRGTDYAAIPGMAMLDLTAAASGSGAGATVVAVVRIELLAGAPLAAGSRNLTIVRREGSFQGAWPDGSPTVGVVPGSNEPIVFVSILTRVAIDDAAAIVTGIDPAASQVSAAVTSFCRTGSGGGATRPGCIDTQRAADLLGNPDTSPEVREAATFVLQNNLLAIAPDETTALAFVAPRLATGQLDNVALRQAAMRDPAQAGGASFDGLRLVSHGLPLSLGALSALLGADESDPNEERRTLLGGTKLGFWVNGTLGDGERDRRGANSGFDSDTWELTSGLDYRFTDSLFLGAALGYSRMRADYERDQGTLEADAWSLHGYGGYSLANGLSFDASLSTMRSDYTQQRVIELLQLSEDGTSFSSLGRDVARGETSVTQHSASVGMTWTYMREAWTIAPQAQWTGMRTEYDAFRETGPSSFNLDYRARQRSSWSISVGSHVDRTFATSIGAFRPYVRGFWYVDGGGPVRDLLAEFALPNVDGSHTALSLSMNEADTRYASGEVGLGFSRPIGTRTVDFNFGYMQMFGFDDWKRRAVRFDLRLPL